MNRLRLLASVAMMAMAVAADAQQSEMRLDLLRESLTGTHRHYQQYIDGIPVVGGERSETLLREGALRVDYDRSAHMPGVRASSRAAIGRPAADGNNVYVNVNGEARLARRVIVEPRRLEPHAQYFDAATGELLRDDALFYTAKQGRVFDVDPVAKLNAPWLSDQNDSAAAVPIEAYSEVDLPDLNPSGPLTGPNVQIVDLEAPFTPRADAAGSLDFDRSQPQFEEVNAYFQIDRSQRYLQSIGYTGSRRLVAYSIPVDAHAANGTDNSYYIQGSPPGRGTLYFGDGGTEDAEDSDIMLHEFGHAIHDWIIPGALTGPSSSQARAISEGFGDYWSFSSTYALTIPSGRDPFCIADWDARCAGDDPSKQCGYPAGADCLRRVDSTKTMADYIKSDDAGTEHKNGMIWSSALREIFMTLTRRNGLDAGKRISDTIVLESLFGLPPGPEFRTVAQSMIAADRQLRSGSEVDVICAAMTSRGIFATGDCGNVPRGEWTLFQSPDHGLPIPDGTGSMTTTIAISDTRAISKLAVRVDIAHSSRGDLVISLVAPNGTTVKLKESSQTDRTPDVHATFGIDAPAVDSLDVFAGQPANGTWKLVVSDIYAGDTGALESWSLLIDFAGDAPMTTRPTTSAARTIVPVVGHAIGAAGTQYTSDVYLLNRGSRDTTATLIFTPSGANGTATFGAMKAGIAAGQTIVFRDIVASLFAMSGTGTLEIDGDPNLIATSITRNSTPAGDVAQSIPAVSSAASIERGDRPVFALPLIANSSRRTNAGIVETGGGSGTVRLMVVSPSGAQGAQIDVPILPFSHIQMPVSGGGPWSVAEFTVVSGDARVLGYLSVVDSQSGDAMFVPAQPLTVAPATITIPAVGRATGTGALWDSEVWYASLDPFLPAPAKLTFIAADSTPFPPTLVQPGADMPTLFPLIPEPPSVVGQIDVALPASAMVVARTYTRSVGASVGDRAAESTGASSLDVLHVESTAAFRTNFGIAALDPQPTEVAVTLFDGAGHVLASDIRHLGGRGSVQVPVSALYAGQLTNGHLHFEAVAGGRIAAYASVLDNRTNDPVIVQAR